MHFFSSSPSHTHTTSLRRIVEPLRDEIIGDWRKFHNEELRMIKVKEDEMDMACSTHEEAWECIQDFSGKVRRKATARDF
jgi:hypothetical protein